MSLEKNRLSEDELIEVSGGRIFSFSDPKREREAEELKKKQEADRFNNNRRAATILS